MLRTFSSTDDGEDSVIPAANEQIRTALVVERVSPSPLFATTLSDGAESSRIREPLLPVDPPNLAAKSEVVSACGSMQSTSRAE